MSPEIYEVVSQGARYWFLFLMGVIVWRSYRWLARDRKQRKKRLRLLPDAGFIGELVVQTGQESLPPGTVLPVPREGTLGSSRGCDLCVSLPGVARTHLWFRYEDGVGLRVRPLGSNKIQVDGLACEHRRQGLLMLHGSRLALGEGVLRLRMFAGFETTAHAAPLEAPDFEDETEEAAPQAAPPARGRHDPGSAGLLAGPAAAILGHGRPGHGGPGRRPGGAGGILRPPLWGLCKPGL